MKAAVLQPYFFPYIGYFQLIAAVDTFVFLDDVQYIDRGWVNRNLVRLGNRARWLTMPVRKAPRETPIHTRFYLPCEEDADDRLLRLVSECYGRARHFDEAFPLVRELIGHSDRRVSTLNANLLSSIGRRLGARCNFIFSSQLEQADGLRGQLKILDICRRIGASHYINPPGGMALYDRDLFEQQGVSLSFIQTTTPPAALQDGPQHLSIVDWLMHEGVPGSSLRMHEYRLLGDGA